MNDKKAISPFQLFSITAFSMMLGLHQFSSARGYTINHEWLAAQIISTVIMFLILIMLIDVFSTAEITSFEDIIIGIAGKLPARVLGIFLSFYLLLQSAGVIITESNNIQLFLFDKTPTAVIAAVIVITGFVLSCPGISSQARLAEILILPAIITSVIMLALFISGCSFGEVKPLLQPDLSEIISRAVESVTCFTCIEVTGFFICSAAKGRKTKTAVLAGFAIPAIIMLLITVCIAGTFTVSAGSSLIYPVTELSRTVQLRYLRVIERLDVIILTLSTTCTCVFTSLVCRSADSSLALVFNPKKIRYSVPFAILLLLAVILASDKGIPSILATVLTVMELILLFIIIPILFFVAKFKRKKQRNET